MISPSEDVYEAAARTFALGGNPENRYLYDTDETAGGYAWHIDYDAHATAQERPFRAAVDSAYFAGEAAGRAQAAADIRAQIIAGAWPPFLGVGAKPRAADLAEWAARIAEGGEPRG